MDIAVLLNADDGADTEWDMEVSDTEEEEANGTGGAESDDVSDSESAAGALPPGERRAGNAYVDGIIHDSGLHIIREGGVKAAYEERGELGLLSLFFTREFRDSLHTWTNEMLKEKGKPEATVCELDAYIGLEIAMSFNPVTEIKEL